MCPFVRRIRNDEEIFVENESAEEDEDESSEGINPSNRSESNKSDDEESTNEEEIEEESYDDSTNASDTPSIVSNKKSEDLKDRIPDDRDTMKTSRSTASGLEGVL